jgi:GT2 family glycosyltransferase
MSTTLAHETSVVVLCEGGPAEAGRCLAALARQHPAPAAEVVVVDATPAGDALPGPLPAGCRRVRAEPAAGRAAALAAGAAAASGRLLAFLHGDAEPEPGWLAPLLAAAGGPTPAIAGSRVTFADGTAVDGLLLAYARPYPLSPVPQVDTSAASGSRGALPVPAACGVALALPAALLGRLGGFDEAFTAGGEDVDLCLRAGQAGVPVVVVRASRVRHHATCATPRPGQGGEPLLGERWLGRVPLLDPGQLHGRAPVAPRPGRPPLSVVVPLLDAGLVAARCLEDALRHLPPGDELVVADAGSRDGSRALARLLVAEAPDRRRLVEAAGGDLTAAARAGLAAARRPLVALLQPVEAMPDGLLDELALLLERHAEVDLLAFPTPPAGLVAAGRLGAMQRLGELAPDVFFAEDAGPLQAAAARLGVRVAALG